MKIAVVGGGIFGISVAIRLSSNHEVDLFEKNPDILQAASGINQYRLHQGYHYPRSQETALSAQKSEICFKNEFADAIIYDIDHYYCIAKNDSLTTKNNYLKFCEQIGLEYHESLLENVNFNKIDLCVKVKENLFDLHKLKQICWKKIKKNNINIFTNKEVELNNLQSYDYIVIATYANLNQILKNLPEYQVDYQFEICEKPVVKLPNSFNKKSIVIMDGPFMCVDPFGSTGNFVLGNVVHAIHHTNIGKLPVIPKEFVTLLNKGVISNPPITNIELFKKSGSNFIPDLEKAEHIGSMFTIRTVLPNLENTDARPTIVNQLNENLISIFSGKIGNCVDAAHQVDQLITN